MRPHLGQGARRLGLDDPQRLARSVRLVAATRARLGADRDRRDVVSHRVVQLTGQPPRSSSFT